MQFVHSMHANFFLLEQNIAENAYTQPAKHVKHRKCMFKSVELPKCQRCQRVKAKGYECSFNL